MRIAIAILLFLVYSATLVRPVFPYLEYSLNKDFIVAVLCLNKDKPELHCEGTCYLDEQLKKVSEEENESLPGIPAKTEIKEVLYLSFVNEQLFKPIDMLIKDNRHASFVCYYSLWSKRPPTPPPQVFS